MLLHFTTAGSVDDGKSTLIGRILMDSKAILQDQYEATMKASQRRGETEFNLALLTDGLKAEREQGITIDVAYRYFATAKRKYIIADTPGHVQYTRNMVTGASTANVALILVDARHGVVEQTRRHAIIASLLQIPHIVLCINKMDLVDYDEKVYHNICESFYQFAAKLDIRDIQCIPISALLGDNIVQRSSHMDWYEGPTLMYFLDHVHIAGDANLIDVRFPVQLVIRPTQSDYRGYAGTLAGGQIRVGDEVVVLPSGFSTKISHIDGPSGAMVDAQAGQAITIRLADQLDVGRGDMIVRTNNQPSVTQDLELMICWFNRDSTMQTGGRYLIKHTTREVKAMVKEVLYKLDINTLHRDLDKKEVNMNDIARVRLRTTAPLFIDAYRKNRATGSVILIDEHTNETVAAGMVI